MTEQEIKPHEIKMKYSDFENFLKELDLWREKGVKGFDLFNQLKYHFPNCFEIRYMEKPLKSSDEEREYQAFYRQKQKQIKAEQDKEKRFQEKMQYAKENRNKFFCYRCQGWKEVPLDKRSVTLAPTPHSTKKRIDISANCPVCQSKLKHIGGYLSN